MADHNIPDAPALEGATHLHSGKVRDLYRIESGEHAGRLLMVASDRISAYDFVLDTTIPDKGEILTRMSLWWFDQLKGLVAHHVVSTDVPEAVRGRAVICEELDMYPVECVARGYLTGSGLLDYRHTGDVCGIALPAGLQDGSRLPEPIFTPATKAAVGDHDENVDYEAVVEAVGDDEAAELRMLTMEVYGRAHELARDPRHHPGRHQGRVRCPARRHHGAGRRGAHPRLVAVLAGRRVAARSRPAVVRQADRPRLAHLARVGLGPDLRRGAAAAAGRGRGAHPLAVRRGVRATDRGDVLTTFAASVDLPVPVEVAYAYLSDPRNRPAWQSSLRSVTVPVDEEPHLGQRWQETTSVGVRPHMEIIEMDPPLVWAERGRWRGVEATLTLGFARTPRGCRVDISGDVGGRGLWSVPAVVAGRLAGIAVAADVRKAGEILARDDA